MGRLLTGAVTLLMAAAALALLASSLEQWIPGTRARLDEPVLTPPGERITVDVLNAGGLSGMARTATDELRNAGFDVVDFGNAARFDLDSSVVIDRIGNLQLAAAVADALGIRRIVSQPDSNLFVDVTVRLGADWTALPLAGDGGEGPSGLDWLRSLLQRR